jgi:hypothetical protein
MCAQTALDHCSSSQAPKEEKRAPEDACGKWLLGRVGSSTHARGAACYLAHVTLRNVKRVGITLALAVVACASYMPEADLPVARDLDCSEKITIVREEKHTIATGCGRKMRYRCVLNDVGERRCIAKGDESLGADSETWVKDVR